MSLTAIFATVAILSIGLNIFFWLAIMGAYNEVTGLRKDIEELDSYTDQLIKEIQSLKKGCCR